MFRCFDSAISLDSVGFWMTWEDRSLPGGRVTIFVCQAWWRSTSSYYAPEVHVELPPQHVKKMLEKWGQLKEGVWVKPKKYGEHYA